MKALMCNLLASWLSKLCPSNFQELVTYVCHQFYAFLVALYSYMTANQIFDLSFT